MKREQSSGVFLSAVFVDYDNIYMSLKRKSDEAAKRFAKDAGLWIKAIETGRLITPTNGPGSEGVRRIVMNRCYGNPVPRRNQSDNSTDMSSFPFVRHHFLRSGFEIVDCPPLTAQLKNSSDIRMVMDVRDYLTHATYFDEFIILSGDADFTPVLHRLRAHARRTVIFANDNTAAPYTAICDGEIRESDLIALLLENRVGADQPVIEQVKAEAPNLETIRREILAEVTATVRGSQAPVPLEVLADRAVRLLGHERTIGTAWTGAGGFRDLLAKELPDGLRLSGEPPFVVVDTSRHLAAHSAPVLSNAVLANAFLANAQAQTLQQTAPAEPGEARRERNASLHAPQGLTPPVHQQAVHQQAAHQQAVPQPVAVPLQPAAQLAPAAPARDIYAPRPAAAAPNRPLQAAPFAAPQQQVANAAAYAQPAQPQAQAQAMPPRGRPAEPVQQQPQYAQPHQSRGGEAQSLIQQSISRIHDACQAPPLAPPEYRLLFETIAQEINENGLIGAQTIHNIAQLVQDRGIDIRRDDVRFVLEVVSEADPWFEQGASANLFAGRFRNFVVARCRSQGLHLSADELDLIEAWFAGSTPAQATQPQPQPQQQMRPAPTQAYGELQAPQPMAAPAMSAPAARLQAPAPETRGWSLEEGRQYVSEQRQQARPPQAPAAEAVAEDFPRIVRTRLRG